MSERCTEIKSLEHMVRDAANPSIFECLSAPLKQNLFVNGMPCQTGLFSNWQDRVRAAPRDNENMDDVYIWSFELKHPVRHEVYPYFVTFGELCKAITPDHGETWHIENECGKLQVRFKQ